MIFGFDKLAEKGLAKLGAKGLVLKKHAPDILLATGIASIGGGVVMACKATIKAETVMEERHAKLETVKEALEAQTSGDVAYSQKEADEDVKLINAQTAIEVARLYIPAGGLLMLGVLNVVAAHNVQRNRLAALAAGYNGLLVSFAEYRSRVVEDQGADKDLEYLYGTVDAEVLEVKTVKGKEKQDIVPVKALDKANLSIYARVFDDGNPEWTKDPTYNLHFLKTQQTVANQIFAAIFS